ncbi:MAG: hypothetical protein Homavirus44_3 [Homavirus sp.]|uniref:Leucine-rich repeat protein n=1 Tax=Homavirus sp. TaxID=2487769 RepID=A0A3G5A580_9VIRU|nr:MAG: hypothetical protein Homavirus44_3 [Homavirus sp.]
MDPMDSIITTNEITIENADLLNNKIALLNDLKTIKANHVNLKHLTDTNCTIILDSISQNKNINKLTLFNLTINKESSQHLFGILKANRLSELTLDYVVINVNDLSCLIYLIDGLKYATSLVYLRIGSIIDDEPFAKIITSLNNLPHLTHLCISNKKASSLTSISLANLLMMNRLTTLNLISCEMDDIEHIVTAMHHNWSLRSLNLNTNLVHDEGCTMLAQMLELNTTLKELCLYNNHITNQGAKRLGAALRKNSSLTTLDLEDNYFNSELIINALRHNTSLTELDLYNDRQTGRENYDKQN